MPFYLLYITKKTAMISQIIDQLAFCHFYQNHFKVFYMKKEKPLPKTYCQNIREGFEKKAPNIHTSNFWKMERSTRSWQRFRCSFGSLLKAFDCIVYDLLLAKLSTCGLEYNSLKFINSFLSSRKFRRKTCSSCSPYLLDLLVGVP